MSFPASTVSAKTWTTSEIADGKTPSVPVFDKLLPRCVHILEASLLAVSNFSGNIENGLRDSVYLERSCVLPYRTAAAISSQLGQVVV